LLTHSFAELTHYDLRHRSLCCDDPWIPPTPHLTPIRTGNRDGEPECRSVCSRPDPRRRRSSPARRRCSRSAARSFSCDALARSRGISPASRQNWPRAEASTPSHSPSATRWYASLQRNSFSNASTVVDLSMTSSSITDIRAKSRTTSRRRSGSSPPCGGPCRRGATRSRRCGSRASGASPRGRPGGAVWAPGVRRGRRRSR